MSKQNTGRKFFATAATAALVASAIVPVASAAEFTDAEKIASWATEAVEALATNEVISGNPDGSFNPTGTVTRAQAAKMFTVALGLDTKGTETFTDVKDGQWFQEFVVAVVNAGIVNGMTATEFAPNGELTREQAAKMIVEAYGLEGAADLSTFADAKSVSGKWSEGYLATAVENGIIAGKGDKLAATDSISRQEFAVMLNRAITGAAVDHAAELTEALTALDEAVKALNTEVKVAEIATAKVEVATAKEAIVAVEAALEAGKEVLTEEEAAKATTAVEAAKKAVEATEAVIVKAEEAAKELTVESVTAINATQVEVKFTKAVDAATLFADGISGAFATTDTVSLTTLDDKAAGTLTGKLSEDGKTLTITAANVLEKRYDFAIKGLKATDAKAMKEYKEMMTISADEKAPTIVGTEQISSNQVKINFSEPVKAHSSATLVYADGKPVVGASVVIPAGATSVTVDLSADAVEIDKVITITFIGVQDQAGNLLTPNPATVTVTKLKLDGVKPTVSAITQTGAKTFKVQFSKDLAANPTVLVGNTTADVAKVSANEYKVTVPANLSGLQNVTVVAGYKDLAGQEGEATTKVINFTLDTVAPKVTSTKTVTVDGVEYLELAFDKEVTEGNIQLSGSYSKDFITETVTATTVPVTYASAKDKKVVRVALNRFATVEGAAYKLNITSGTVMSLSGVAFEKTAATFTRGKDVASNTTKLAAPTITQTTNDTLTVTFNTEVDGESATNVDNYIVDGAVVETASLAVVVNGKQVVTLNLKKDSNAFTGTRNITVQNVKALGSSVTMDKFVEKAVSLTENVRPTVSAIELTKNDELTLTFSEVVTNVDNTDVDFVLYIDGKPSTLVLTAEVVAQAKEKLVLTITNGTLTEADLVKGLTIKPVETINVVDAKSNKLNFSEITYKK